MEQHHSDQNYSPRRVRRWAWNQGINIPKVGVIPREVIELYLEVRRGKGNPKGNTR